MGSRLGSRFYETLFNTVPHPVIVVDHELKIVLGNASASTLFQLSQEQLKGVPIASLISHKESHATLQRLVADAPSLLQPSVVVELHPPEDQQGYAGRILKVTMLPLKHNPEGDLRLLVLEDVSERVMLENQLVEIEKLAGMGQLAQGIAHELGNPLSSMSFTLQYIRESLGAGGNPGLAQALDITLDSLDQMHHLLRTLSEFSGVRQPHYEATDLRRLISQSLAFIDREVQKRRIRLVTSFASSLPPCQIDVRRIKQVLLNLFKNAIEAMSGGGQLSVETRPGALPQQGSPAAMIEIRDTGVGIGAADLRTVFRPLYTTKPRGTGLGLSFCREVIEEHGGEIQLTSQKGKGTTVTLILPIQQEVADA